jgi:hypothetical protein
LDARNDAFRVCRQVVGRAGDDDHCGTFKLDTLDWISKVFGMNACSVKELEALRAAHRRLMQSVLAAAKVAREEVTAFVASLTVFKGIQLSSDRLLETPICKALRITTKPADIPPFNDDVEGWAAWALHMRGRACADKFTNMFGADINNLWAWLFVFPGQAGPFLQQYVRCE